MPGVEFDSLGGIAMAFAFFVVCGTIGGIFWLVSRLIGRPVSFEDAANKTGGVILGIWLWVIGIVVVGMILYFIASILGFVGSE